MKSRVVVLMASVVSSSLAPVTLAAAQSVIVRSSAGSPSQRGVSVSTSVNTAGSCQSDDEEFQRLTRLPEGMALLRLRSDLDAAARIGTLRSAQDMPGARVREMQREVDSLSRIIDRVMVAAPRRGQFIASELEERGAVTMRVRALEPQVEHVVQLALARIDRAASPPTLGYFGVTLSSVPFRQVLQSGYIVSYCEYPVVESVDPGSPAERGGVQAGDTIVAFNNQDVLTGMVDYTALLVPNSTLRVRTRRAGRTTEHAVRVVPRPGTSPVRMTARAIMVPEAPVAAAPQVAIPTPSRTAFVFERAPQPSAAQPAGVTMMFMRDTTNPITINRVEPPFPLGLTGVSVAGVSQAASAPTPPGMIGFSVSADDAVFAGAQLKSLSAELQAALSLPDGVLVWKVLRGTPAADGGLRDGDVIRSANGRVVQRVNDVRVAFESAVDARALTLRIHRKDAPERTVVLRW